MKRKLKMPEFLEGKTIEHCYECPFYDAGDGGWGDHCNIKDILKMKNYKASIWDCPFLDIVKE